MKIHRLTSLFVFATSSLLASAQFEGVNQTLADNDNQPAPVFPVPDERQIAWHETEYYAFFHYGMNTYTGQDWGSGSESPSTFAPTAAPNPRQWLTAAQSAGMKGGIAVVKHHDGFCLWPTATTSHSVKNCGSSYDINIPRDFGAAAQDLGMKYGFYISPWDRNSQYWGDGTLDYVTKVFLPQCVEMKAYGDDQFEIWFDGAAGDQGYYGGANTTRTISKTTYYDMPNLREALHGSLPNACMWGLGLDLRWIGNENGVGIETNWCMVNRSNDPANNKGGGVESGWSWCPGECDAMATNNGWFWKSGEGIKTAERLFQMYLETVGRNSNLILNLPPDKSGSLPTATVNICQQLGNLLQTRLGTDLALNATSVTATSTRSNGATRTYNASNVIDNDKNTYWAASDGTTSATITLQWDQAQTMHYVSLQEYIRLGQRVKSFTIETSTDGSTWTQRGGSATTTTIGYKRIIPLDGSTSSYGSGVSAKYLRIKITDCRSCPTLHTVSVY